MSFIPVITTKGIKETGKKLRKYTRLIKSSSRIILKDMGEHVAGISRSQYLIGPGSKTKLGQKSGDLSRSIQVRVSGKIVEVGSNLVYAPVHEFGATIKPKKGEFLTFKIGAAWVSVKEVVIPKRPFLAPALKDSRSGIIKILEAHMRKIKKEAFR